MVPGKPDRNSRGELMLHGARVLPVAHPLEVRCRVAIRAEPEGRARAWADLIDLHDAIVVGAKRHSRTGAARRVETAIEPGAAVRALSGIGVDLRPEASLLHVVPAGADFERRLA